MVRDVHYFGAGPAALPTAAVERAAEEFIEYGNCGVGLGEISHRSKEATNIINDTKTKIVELLKVPDTHEVLFVQGGGTGGFAAVTYAMEAFHFSKTGKLGRGDYFVTGSWSSKAISEAQRLGVPTNIVCSGKNSNGKFTGIPKETEYKFSPAEDTAYVYYCDNETVHGIEFKGVPQVPEGTDLVVDVSSNFLSRPIDVSRHAIIFGGAQKNVGIPGISVYIVRKDIIKACLDADPALLRNSGVPVAPSLLDLGLIAKNNSAYNTLSIFAVECINLVLGGLLQRGGIEAQSLEAESKARKLYELIDRNSDFITEVEPAARSRMNIVFKLPDSTTESRFLEEAAKHKLLALKGHRSVGGIRISNYNAITPEDIDILANFMSSFK